MSSGSGCRRTSSPGDYAPLAQLAEDAGFDVVTTFNDLWFQPALPALLEIAGATTRVRVGPSCLNPFTVHPVEIAGQIAALDAGLLRTCFPRVGARDLARAARPGSVATR